MAEGVVGRKRKRSSTSSVIALEERGKIRSESQTVMSGPRILPRGGAAVAIGFTTIAAVGAIIYSHVSQVEDRKVMRAGVERDKERLRMKRLERKQREQEQNR